MSSSAKPFTIATLEDRTFAVVRTDPRKPRLLEVIAIFSEVERARDYADTENQQASEQQPSIAPITAAGRKNVIPAETSSRERA